MIEKSIHDQAQDYLERNELLHIYQSGSRANQFIDICLSRLTDMILNGAENGRQISLILINLYKASDILDHNISLDNMKCIGFSDKAIKCFHSYLTNRAFFVLMDRKNFSNKNQNYS